MSMKTPIHPDELSPEWVTFALREGGYLKNSKATKIDTKILGTDMGLLSSVVRVGIEYDSKEDGAPDSVVVKMQPEQEWSKEFNEELSAFQREIRFYREIANTANIRLPKFYYAVDEPPAYTLVFEDLSYFTPGDQVVGMHQSEVLDTVEIIAKLQAQYWNNEALEKLTWMPKRNGVSDNFKENWSSFVENYGHFLSDKAVELGDKLSTHIDWKNAEIEKRPTTLVHADLREDNILFPPKGSDESIVIVDWQLTIKSIGAADVARLLDGSELPEERKGHQLEVLRRWYDTLLSSGVTNYSWDEAVYDFRLGVLSHMCYPVHFHKSGIGCTGRLKELIEVIYKRTFASAVESDAISILPD